MPNESKVDFIQPSGDEIKVFWEDVQAVCEKHSMVLGTGFSFQKAVKVVAVDKKELEK